MEIGIIGAGITGLTAAYELGRRGHHCSVYEQADEPGGLSATFKDERWDWPLERFYHHLFASDDIVLDFSRDLGLGDKLMFPRPITAIWKNCTIDAFDDPVAVLRYPYLPFIDKVRVGLVTLYLRLTSDWKKLEQVPAHEWLAKYYGERAYRVLWEPLLVNKFGRFYQEVNAAWFWARIYKRTPRLGYFVGGYQTLIDALVNQVKAQGNEILLRTRVSRVEPCEAGVCVTVEDREQRFDAVIATVSPSAMVDLAPGLSDEYLDGVRQLRSVGAVALILALDRHLVTPYYWINLPKGEFPFLAFVEHTNFQSPEHYGGDHLVYLADYPERGSAHMTKSKEELLEEWLPSLAKFNSHFDPSWVRRSWLFREDYAQPIVPVGYSRQIPSIRTPVRGLYFASMSHVYPWDRGSNYAVEMGQRLAAMVVEDGA